MSAETVTLAVAFLTTQVFDDGPVQVVTDPPGSVTGSDRYCHVHDGGGDLVSVDCYAATRFKAHITANTAHLGLTDELEGYVDPDTQVEVTAVEVTEAPALAATDIPGAVRFTAGYKITT